MDNNDLITAVAGGDDAALRELFARHAPWIAARLHAVLPATDVEDVIQDAFLRGLAAEAVRALGAQGSVVEVHLLPHSVKGCVWDVWWRLGANSEDPGGKPRPSAARRRVRVGGGVSGAE